MICVQQVSVGFELYQGVYQPEVVVLFNLARALLVVGSGSERYYDVVKRRQDHLLAVHAVAAVAEQRYDVTFVAVVPAAVDEQPVLVVVVQVRLVSNLHETNYDYLFDPDKI